MAVVDRIDPAYPAWTPSASGIATESDEYTGHHRMPDSRRGFSLARMFYTARHRRR